MNETEKALIAIGSLAILIGVACMYALACHYWNRYWERIAKEADKQEDQ